MKAAALLLLPLLLAVACGGGDDDKARLKSDNYYSVVRDLTQQLFNDRSEVQSGFSSPPITLMDATLAPAYRAEAGVWRYFADHLDAQEPAGQARDAHKDLVGASRAMAAGLDELADLFEREPRSVAIIQQQQDVQKRMAPEGDRWLAACDVLQSQAPHGALECRLNLFIDPVILY